MCRTRAVHYKGENQIMNTAIVIPAYKPEDKLLALVDEFKDTKDIKIVVVDDGSGSEFEPVFSALPEWVVLLRHEVNHPCSCSSGFRGG